MAASSVKDEDRVGAAPHLLPSCHPRAPSAPDPSNVCLQQSQNGGEGIMSIPGAEDTIDPSTFEQILEMDEDEDEREFSKSIVYDFFTQAESTFVKMDTSL